MEWASGIEGVGRKMVPIFLGMTGKTGGDEIWSVAEKGVPTTSKITSKRFEGVNFSSWKAADTNEYLRAFSFSEQPEENLRHRVFEFSWKRTRFLVPALLLMRALILPKKHLLPAMFGIQGLEQSFFLDFSQNPPRPTVHANWSGREGRHRGLGNGSNASMQWLALFPSAYDMANSIHRHALNGWINLDLPHATINGRVHGKKVNGTYFVTDLSVSSLEAHEESFDFSGDVDKSFFLVPCNPKFMNEFALQPGTNGSMKLSSTEWEAVKPTLLQGLRHNSIKLDQKLLFEDVLLKIATDTPWRKLHCQVGKWVNTSQAYLVWKKNGSLYKAIELLNDLRKLTALA